MISVEVALFFPKQAALAARSYNHNACELSRSTGKLPAILRSRRAAKFLNLVELEEVAAE